jgi:ATP-binding cassette, subfamily B, bacterial MsbA
LKAIYAQIKRLWPYVKEYKRRAILAFLCSFPMAAIKAYQVYLIKPVFDKGFGAQATLTDAVELAGLIFLLALLNYPFRYFHFYGIKMTMEKVTCELRSLMYRKFQTIPVSYFSKNKSGEMLSKTISDTMLFSESLKHALDLVREPITGVLLLCVAFYHDYQLTLSIFIVIPLFIFVFNKTGFLIRKYTAQMQSYFAQMTHDLSEGIMGQKVVKAFNLQEYVRKRFDQSQNDYLNFRKKHVSIEEHAHPLVETIGALMFAGIIILAHHRITNGHLTTGSFVSFIGAMAMIMDPIRKYSNANVKLNTARVAGDRIFSLLDYQDEIDTGTIEFKEFKDCIEFRDITFSYGEGDVVKDFSLIIKKGQRAGLVGLSGSGKSTLINLILRLYNVEKGEILIDGIKLQDYTLQSLRDQFALVSQDLFLFNDTVRENILVGNFRTDKEMQYALEVSYAKEYIDKLPEGLDTSIGDRGLKLSGGQCQRLTIARAFLSHAPIYLFDEATSALDNESEQIVQAALDKVAGNKTVIAVAHRLSTIQDYDKIVVMKDGLKIEEGTHDELMQMGGEYQKLYELSQKA